MIKRFSIVFGFVACFATPVHAACKQGNLKGGWVGYVTGLLSASVERCNIVVSNSGGISGTCTDVIRGIQFNIINGKYSLDSSCHIDGCMGFANGVTACIDAQLSKDKFSLSGVFANSAGNLGTFSGQKR